MPKTLVRRLVLPNLALFALMALAFALVARQAVERERALRTEVDRLTHQNAQIIELNAHVGDLRDILVRYRINSDRAFLADVAIEDRDIERLQGQLVSEAQGERGRALAAELQSRFGRARKLREEMLQAISSGDASVIEPSFRRWSLQAELHRAALADLSAYQLRRLSTQLGASAAAQTRVQYVAIALLLIAAGGLLLFSLMFFRTIVRPLRVMTSAAQRMATERTWLPVPLDDRQDEMGTLSRALNRMTASLTDANRKLTEALQVREDFLSVASHELRTPLTTLKLQLHLLERELSRLEDPQALRRPVAAFEKQVERMVALVQDLLDVSRIAAGKFQMQPRDEDLTQLVAGVAERYNPELQRAGVELHLDLQPGVRAFIDERRIEQVLINLLANLTKYAPGAPAYVTLRSDGARAQVTVRDSGPGIAPENRALIFERFQRANATPSISGLGLGLYICKSIAEAHGGAIRAEGAQGEGASFVLELPATSPASP